MTWWLCTALAWAGSCFPWNDFHHRKFLGYSFCSAQLWQPGAQQIDGEPVSCDSSVSIGEPVKGPMFTGLFTWDFVVSSGGQCK
jgi:hypothetical protein